MLRLLLFLAILLPGVIASFRSRFAALLLYLWFAFFRPEDWLWVDVSALRLSLVLGLLLIVPSILSGIYPTVTHPLSVGAIVFLLAAFNAQFSAVDPALGWYWLDYFLKLLLVSLMATTLVTDRKRFLMAVMVIACSLGFHAAKAGLASLLSGGARFASGLGGAFPDNNGYGIAMAMIAPLLVCVAQNTVVRTLRWGCWVAVPLVMIGAVGTYSRSAFLAMLASGVVLVACQRRRFTWMILASILVVPVGIFVSRQEGYVDRMRTIQTYEQVDETSAISRVHFWRVAVEIFNQHPFGIGLFNYEAMFDRYDSLNGRYGHRRSVHSSHFQVLAETGIVGTLAWIFVWGYAVVLTWRIRRRGRLVRDPDDAKTYVTSANAILASMVAFLVGGSFNALALNDLSWITFALLAALDRISIAGVSTVEVPQRRLTETSSPLVNALERA